MSDYLLVGGGVIGLLLARELGQAGARVTLLERGEAARESSWAGGGIVSPLYPWRYPDPVTALASWSQGFYPQLAERLREETGIDPELRRRGLLMIAPEDQAQALAWARHHRRPMAEVTADEIYAREPGLAPGFSGGLWMPEVASIRNPRLGKALGASLGRLPGVRLRTQVPVTGFRLSGDRVVGVDTADGPIYGGTTVVTAGAWSGVLLQTLGVQLPVAPVRGQMILYRAPQGLLNRVVLKAGRYLIPRADGRILMGSTLEHCGFERATTAEARASLMESAAALLPGLAGCEPEHHWAGLRPGSPEGIPFIGPLPGYRGLMVNAGHFRNGLVLAPASVRLLADLLLARTPILDPRPYALEGRLGAEAAPVQDAAS